MKFLKCKKKINIKISPNYDVLFNNHFSEIFLNLNFKKLFIKKNKYIVKSKFGIVKNKNKISLIRDKNFSFISQYINLNTKKGKKLLFFNNFNKAIENIYHIFNVYYENFNIYENYLLYMYLYNNNYYLSSYNNLIFYSIDNLESIFEIKTIKNSKKLKLSNKYNFEIVYIPEKKRLKYVLRSLSVYKESFKNYSLWERLFWSLLLIILNKKNSFILKRRNYIYSKSIKFFKKK